MTPKQSTRAPKLAMILAIVLLVATTALAAAQSPDVLLPLITGDGQTQQAVPEMPLESDPVAPIGDSRDTHSGDFEQAPAEPAAVDAFNTTQWTVQNNVGIGTDAPTSDLDLARNVNNYTRIWVRNPNAGGNAQSQLALTTASSYSLALQQFGSGFSASWNGKSLKNMARLRTSPSIQGLILTTGGSYPLIMGTADQERMRIAPDGRVGIGTTTPHHQLSIAGGPPWTEWLWGGAVELTNRGAIAWRANASGNSYGMARDDYGFHLFRAAASPGTTVEGVGYDLTITDNGHVGIGSYSTSNTSLLYVNGSTEIWGELKVNGTTMQVPDYVFEPEYSLMPLDELRAYVAEEKHLPNVPDAEQIAQHGVNVTDFQMKLLEKTEELTLYTLAQDEQIERLQQENQAMQEMIADLEARLAALEEQK